MVSSPAGISRLGKGTTRYNSVPYNSNIFILNIQTQKYLGIQLWKLREDSNENKPVVV